MSKIEDKIKLSLRPSIGTVSEKQPKKLLINHGKPNYTINRSVAKARQEERRQQQQKSTTESTIISNESNGYPKVTLKKTPLTPTNSIPLQLLFPTTNESNPKANLMKTPVNPATSETNVTNGHSKTTLKTIPTIPTLLSSYPLKKSISPSNHVTNNDNNTTSSTKDEFIAKRQQIFAKIERENSTEGNGYLNRIENYSNNGFTTALTLSPPTSPKYQNYVTNANGQNETILKSPTSTLQHNKLSQQQHTNQNGHMNNDATTNANTSPTTSYEQNEIKLASGNTTLNHSNVPLIPSSPNGNANFEQKTFVSFSKELASEPNKYPDVVKVVKQAPSMNGSNVTDKDKEVLQELTKLKFDIDVQEDVIVKPVIRSS